MVTSKREGRQKAKVAETEPHTPATLKPVKVAELMPIGPVSSKE